MQIFKIGQRRRGVPEREPALSAQSRKYVVVDRDMQVGIHCGQVGQDILGLIGCLLSCGAELRQLKPRATLARVEDERPTVPDRTLLADEQLRLQVYAHAHSTQSEHVDPFVAPRHFDLHTIYLRLRHTCTNYARPAGKNVNMSLRNLRASANVNVIGCLLYTSDAADDLLCVDLGGRRII